MAKSTRTFKAKVRAATKNDIFTSVAIVSIALNLFLASAVIVVTSNDSLDYKFYTGVRSRYCSDAKALPDLVKETTQQEHQSWQVAMEKYEIACASGKFAPYYSQAVNAYMQAQNQPTK